MPELPDITVYCDAIDTVLSGEVLRAIRLRSPFVLRSVAPSPSSLEGLKVLGARRMGKRIAILFENRLACVVHLMIAGRLQFRSVEKGELKPKKTDLVFWDFDKGTLILTEAGSRKRASMVIVEGDGIDELNPGGLEVLECHIDQFGEKLRNGNRTLKRSLTDPKIFSGIGNAYSDEILHRARLSPFKRTSRLEPQEVETLFKAALQVLTEWTKRLRDECRGEFPKKVTAFRKEMAVHGKFSTPCPVCKTPIQRIVYAQNEANYCPSCQTEGRVLADRALSRLLKNDWPRTLDELESLHRPSKK